VHLNQFHESTAHIVCEYEEDLNLSTGTNGVDSIAASGLALWKEGRIPKKWGDYRNNGVFLGWNNEKDSIPGDYVIFLDSSLSGQIEWARALTFLAADAQIDPGQRLDYDDEEFEDKEKDSKKSRKGADDAEKDEDEDEDPVPVDFIVVITDTSGLEYRVRLGDFQNLQPAIKPEIFKSRLFWEDAESEVVLQYVSLPLGKIKSSAGKPVSAGAIRSVGFIFDAEKEGTIILDQLGFAR
jgi:hypothetical protein